MRLTHQMSAVQFYTSCTLTKSAPASASLSVKTLKTSSLSGRFAEWRARVEAWKGERWSAWNLYCGGHWSVVRDLAAGDRFRNSLRCFVISAGYGIVSTDARLAPYSATFAVGSDDSVSLARGTIAPSENVEWWQKLSGWRPAGVMGPRSIRKAFRSAPNSVHLFALSPMYLDAISVDLLEARAELADPEKLIVISTGKKRHGELNGSVIPAPAQLQTALGGALVSLNVRFAAELLNMIPAAEMNVEEVRAFLSDLLREAKPRRIPKRRLVTDAYAVRFIRHAAKSDLDRSYTSILRSFRDAGNACELARFRKLFRQTFKHHNGATQARS